jgi:TPR repeat protein
MCLASCLQSGEGASKSEVEALGWFRKAADKGLAEAKFNVGKCFQNGLGAAVNEAEAFKWFKEAADQGLAQAEFETGLCHWHGLGTPVDLPEAFLWLSLAARRAMPNARENCEELKSEMTPQQMEDATELLNLMAPMEPGIPTQAAEAEPVAVVHISSV